MNRDSRVLVTGRDKAVGAALTRILSAEDSGAVILEDEPDYRDLADVSNYFRRLRPDLVFVAAGRSGGILENTKHPVDLMTDNLVTTVNTLAAAHLSGVPRLLYIASACVYPRVCPQPMRPDALMSGPLEPTNEAYATAKLAGITLCRAYRQQYGASFFAAISANPYGPGDDFETTGGHVVAALIHRMHEAKRMQEASVRVWGSGKPRREFIFVDDLARAAIVASRFHSSDLPLNLGGGEERSIAELAAMIRDVVGYAGEIQFDPDAPDGMPRKLLDSTVVRSFGFTPRVSMHDGIALTYEWYLRTHAKH